MAQTARELIEKARSYTIKLTEAIQLANRAFKIVSRDLDYAQDRLKFKQSDNYPDVFSIKYAQNMKSSAVIYDILMQEIERATEVNEEFSRSMYKDALFSVAKDPDIYRIVPYGRGWNTKISVIIGFEEVAGTISDWAHGIAGYREELGIEPNGNGLKATNWWFHKVYQKSLEVRTFNGRISYAGRPAPFWQILNSGSPSSLPSDRGDGTYNPVISTPTDFIGQAEERIASHFRRVLLGEKEEWESEEQALFDTIVAGQELLNEIVDLINELKADERIDEHIIQQLNARSKSGDITDYTDRHKVREAVKKYRAGEDFTTERIELTAKNADNKRVRPRAATLIRILEGLEEL